MLESVAHSLHIDIFERQIDADIQKAKQRQVDVLQASVQLFHHVGSIKIDS